MSDVSSSPSTRSAASFSSYPSQASTSSHPPSSYGQSSYSHSNLPLPPPPDRMLLSKGNTTQPNGHHKFKLMRKGRDKDKGWETADVDEDWTLEGQTADGHRAVDLLQPFAPEVECLDDSQLTEVPLPREPKIRSSKGRGLAKKTSRLFSRSGDKERQGVGTITPDSSASLNMPSGSRQTSYSSATSSDTNGSSRRHFPLNRPFSHTSSNKSPRSSHSRRLSQESSGSWQAAAHSIRSGSTSAHISPTEGHQLVIPQRQSSNLGASAPSLSRNALPQPAVQPSDSSLSNGTRSGDTFPTRMSTWFSHLLPTTSSTAIAESPVTSTPMDTATASQPSPVRKPPSAAASFLSAARQRAVDGVRHLLESEAQPDKCPDTMWVLGVPHPGWRPTSPGRSPNHQMVDLPDTEDGRRGSSSSGKPSPPTKTEGGVLRPPAWAKRKEPSAPTSSKGFSNLFSSSSLSTALPASVSNGYTRQETDARDTAVDSPGKARSRKAEKEVIRWPDQFFDDFRSRVWCTYRSQYAPILSLPDGHLIPRADAYHSAFGPPSDIADFTPTPDSLAAQSILSRPSPASWSWSKSAEERGLTTDAGWGCMLRTGQSMLANALIHLHLGRDWRVPLRKPASEPHSAIVADIQAYATYVRVLSWFLDDPSPLCPFSVHRMALIGRELGKEVGEWFGPSTASGALKTLANSFPPCQLAVATATDSMVYKSDVCAASNLVADGWPDGSGNSRMTTTIRHTSWGPKAVLILIGIRLGLDGVNPIYHDSVKMLFTFPQSVGIAGGRPSSSYYFVASQANSLFYLDPHLTRPALPLEIPPADPQTSDESEDPDEAILVEQPSPIGRESPVHVPYTLDVVDVDDLSDGSGSSGSPASSSGGALKSSSPRNRLSLSFGTPPSVNAIRHPAPSTPTTPVTISDPFSPTTPTVRTPAPASSSTSPLNSQTAWYANAYSEAQLRTFHCEKVKKMPLSGLDPSMLLGFLCRDEADFLDFSERVSKLPQKIFTVQDEPLSWDDNDEAGLESVSEPEMDDLADSVRGTAIMDGDMDEADTTIEAITISPVRAQRVNGVDEDEDEGWEAGTERRSRTSSQPSSDLPVKERSIISTRLRTESWVETGRDVDEAPNGDRVG